MADAAHATIDAAVKAQAGKGAAKPAGPVTEGASVGGDQTKGAAPAAPPNYSGTKHKLKIEGAEVEVPYEDLIRDAQLGRASTKRFQEAAAMQKRVEAWVEEFNRDPVAAMAKIASGKEGAKFDEIVERYLYAKMQREKMTPEQRQAEERENEIRRLKAAEEARQKETESKSLEEARVKAQRILQGEISTAIEAIGLPKTPEVARRMAQLMLESHTRKDGLTSRQIASYLRTQLIEEHEALLSGLPPEEIATRFPKSAERIRQAEVARLKGGAPAPALNKPKPGERRQPTADEQARAQRGPNGYIRQREWEDAMKGR